MAYVTCHLSLPEHSYQGYVCVYRSDAGLRFSSGLWPDEATAIEKMYKLAAHVDIYPTESEYEGALTPEELDIWVDNA